MPIIWLNEKKYPNNQTTKPFLWSQIAGNYTVCSFVKNLSFAKKIASICLFFAADTTCYIYCNNTLVTNANVKAYGDFLYQDRKNPNQYLGKKEILFENQPNELQFFAMVKMCPTRLYDISSGYGGLLIKGQIYFVDGTSSFFETDDSWLVKLEKGYYDYNSVDQTLDTTKYEKAEEKECHWNLIPADIDLPIEQEVVFDNHFEITGKKTLSFTRDFNLVYSSFVMIETQCDGLVDIDVSVLETSNETAKLKLKTNKSEKIRYLDLLSLGKIKLKIKNYSNNTVKIIIHIYHSHIPYKKLCKIETKNRKLNDLFEKCQFAAINCSQNILLDSPKHCEPLASCAGDYQIISLVYGFSTGDYTLAKHVLRGYSRLMVDNQGLNANSSYALTFISWLWKIYLITGDKQLLCDCLPGVDAVNKLFASFIGDNGLIEKSYNYIFNDWLVVDGYGLFSPPKALGQSVYSMSYYDCLCASSLIYKEVGDEKKAKIASNRSKKLKSAINNLLFDKERGLYIEGLNTPDVDVHSDVLGQSHRNPQNSNKTYIRKHANVLAVAYGLTNKKLSKQIVHKIFGELKDLEIQPFFSHYTFQAIHKAGLDRKYTMVLIKDWLKHVKISDKGLPEGFYKPEASYQFDFSHAWACSPFYSFIIEASGLEIIEPGMKKIKLSLVNKLNKNINYSINTPVGNISFKNGKIVQIPNNIEIIKG